jgi:signal transduction histidine kinase
MRVYLFGLALLILTALTLGGLGRVLMTPLLREQVQTFAGWVLTGVCAQVRDPAARLGAAQRLRTEVHAELALYQRSGTLFLKNVTPPPPPPTPGDRLLLERGQISGRPQELLFWNACTDADGKTFDIALRLPAPRLPSAGSALLLLGAALMMLAALAIPMARSLARPIEALAAAARALGNGNLTVRLRSQRRDEVGDLARAFDEMAERIGQLRRAEHELLANISHELRTPLARVRVATELAAEGDLTRARRCLAEIVRDVEELEKLLADVLLAARTDQLARTIGGGVPPLRSHRLAAQGLLEATVERFGVTHPERLVRFQAAAELPPLCGDPELLRRALDNLLDNAVKYSDDAIELLVSVAEDRLHIAVRDWGIGIDAADLPRLAMPFFRTDRSRARGTGGVGLGLALARRIVEAHGGQLTIESVPGRGTTVLVNLPAMSP